MTLIDFGGRFPRFRLEETDADRSIVGDVGMVDLGDEFDLGAEREPGDEKSSVTDVGRFEGIFAGEGELRHGCELLCARRGARAYFDLEFPSLVN